MEKHCCLKNSWVAEFWSDLVTLPFPQKHWKFQWLVQQSLSRALKKDWFPDPFRHSEQMANKKPGKPISEGPRSRCKL